MKGAPRLQYKCVQDNKATYGNNKSLPGQYVRIVHHNIPKRSQAGGSDVLQFLKKENI